jgi:hypothetical protein
MCEDRLTDRECIELLLGRTVHIANALFSIERYVEEKKDLESRKRQEEERKKWEEERPARIAAFEVAIASLPEWVPAKTASKITGLRTTTLTLYAKNNKIKRQVGKKSWEYCKDDLLPYIEKQKKRLMSAPAPNPRFSINGMAVCEY